MKEETPLDQTLQVNIAAPVETSTVKIHIFGGNKNSKAMVKTRVERRGENTLVCNFA